MCSECASRQHSMPCTYCGGPTHRCCFKRLMNLGIYLWICIKNVHKLPRGLWAGQLPVSTKLMDYSVSSEELSFEVKYIIKMIFWNQVSSQKYNVLNIIFMNFNLTNLTIYLLYIYYLPQYGTEFVPGNYGHLHTGVYGILEDTLLRAKAREESS